MLISLDIYKKILECFPSVPPEAGCILGSQNDVITSFQYDTGLISCEFATYIPDVDRLNATIQKWAEKGILFSGFAHSHLNGQECFSNGDVSYIYEVMRAMPEQICKLYFPLVFPGEKIVSYLAVRSCNDISILLDDIIII